MPESDKLLILAVQLQHCFLTLNSVQRYQIFFEKLVPKQGHQFYLSILGSYKTISNALLTLFLRAETVANFTPKTTQAIQSVEASSDEFVYLATILHQLLPQFGGEPPNLLIEMGNLPPIYSEDYDTFHTRAINLETKLTLALITRLPM